MARRGRSLPLAVRPGASGIAHQKFDGVRARKAPPLVVAEATRAPTEAVDSGPSAARRGDVSTAMPSPRNETVTDPSRSVRYTRAPTAASRSSVGRAGCPYGLSAPAEAIAIRGATAATKASVVAVRLP